ncbi:hypothetical protein SDC9_133470 [bioreactor metagenome]|uniref:Uncharacterized protein n=1 Tax=bioreactor metagenome TaxID=1076179 RepID=A0A645DAQ7_9ZZZZ
MEGAGTVNAREARYPGQGGELIGDRRVHKHGRYAVLFLPPGSDQQAQVGRVLAKAAARGILSHLLIHTVDAALHGPDQPAARGDQGKGREGVMNALQPLLHQALAVLLLRHDIPKGSELFPAVAQGGGQGGIFILKNAQFGGSGA